MPPIRTSRLPLRAWQVRALDAAAQWRSGSFLVSAAPGAGKTRPALEIARRLLESGEVARVALVCPTSPLTQQWAAAAAELGVHLVPDADSPRPPAGFHGVSVTYARVASAAARWGREAGSRTLVIADEAHHLGEDLAWGEGFAAAFGGSPRWLLLSGTPFRSDASAIPGVRYDRDGVAIPDVAYTYADAVRDGVCRPVGFVTYDGTLSWRSGDDVVESTFDTVLTGREASRRYRTAISTDLPDGLRRILTEAHERLLKIRAEGHKDAGGLVIAADGEHAKRVAKLLRETTGVAPVIVLHTETRAAEKLRSFTSSREPWLVAVNMVSEGVDIPRLRVGVYATAAKTPLVFRQIVGRFVRTLPGKLSEPSWLYLPADPILCGHAEQIEGELRVVLRRPDDDGVWDEPEERRRTERSETDIEAFVPLAADVASQMTLFGGAAPAAPRAPVITFASAVGPDPSEDTTVPAYRRRALLRDKRHRLVGELRRRDGRSPREINGWLNREVGIGKVEDASIDQLERSIDVLLGALSA